MELINRWKAGDSRAATRLVGRHAQALARFAASAGEREGIEELVQDTFVRAFASLDSFRGESSMRTWLFTIERRLMLDRRRAERRSRETVPVQESDHVSEYGALDGLIAELDKALQLPGVSNAWTMPIKARTDMLATGIRTPVGIKIIGKDLTEMEKLARQIETVVKAVPGTSSAYAERVIGGYYLDIAPDREALARYGLMVSDVQDTVSSALGGETITTTVEGRERYGVNLRYPRDLRSDPQSIARDVLVAMPGGGTVPLGEVAAIKLTRGPTTIRTENGQLAVYIFVDIRDRDLGGYVADAKAAVAASVQFPPGNYVVWSGQFEYLERATARLKIVVPVTLLIIFLLLYLNFRRLTETLIVMLSLPFALVGGFWLMWWLGFNMSVAVAVGFIALAGVAAETGVIMLIYLDHAMKEIQAERLAEGKIFTRGDLNKAIMLGAVERVRPKMMTVVAIMAGLIPIMWSTGTGSEVMQRIAVPMIGGMISSTILTLVVIPAVYALIKGFGLPRESNAAVPVEKGAEVQITTSALDRSQAAE